MSFKFGFYNAVDGDRLYSAEDFSEMFDGLITDGIYQNIGNAFSVVPGLGFAVNVKTGRAWFNHTWNNNTADYPIELTISDLLLPRIDAIVLEVDTRVAVRANSLKSITGTPAVTPSKPTITKSDGLYQYPLAYVTVPANSNSIVAANIENCVGTAQCPYLSAKLTIMSISEAFAGFEKQYQDWMKTLTEGSDSAILVDLKFKTEALETKAAELEAEEARLNQMLADIQKNL